MVSLPWWPGVYPWLLWTTKKFLTTRRYDLTQQRARDYVSRALHLHITQEQLELNWGLDLKQHLDVCTRTAVASLCDAQLGYNLANRYGSHVRNGTG